MWKELTLDGIEVEFTYSDAVAPPGEVGGQRVNTTALWFRSSKDNDWIRSELRS